MTVYNAKDAYGYDDDFGGSWTIFTEKGLLALVNDKVALSRDYAQGSDGPYLAKSSDADLQKAIESYAIAHKKLSSPEDLYIDKNKIAWIFTSYDSGSGWAAGTLKYGGVVVNASDFPGLASQIEDFASKNKDNASDTAPDSPIVKGGGSSSPSNPSVKVPTTKEAVVSAYNTLKAIRPDLNDKALQVFLSIAILESGFGTLPAYSFTEKDGSPTHNWGARKGTGPAGCFKHGDADEVGLVCFAKYPTADAGARAFMQLFGAAVLAAAATGDAYGVAKAMHAAHYYTGFGCNGKVITPASTAKDHECAVYSYATAIAKTASNIIAPDLGQKSLVLLDTTKRPSSDGGPNLLFLAVLVGAGYLGYKRFQVVRPHHD